MCPQCRHALLTLELDGVEIDHCLDCRGTWLDSGELELILERAEADSAGTLERLAAAVRGEKSNRRCPRCRRRMRVLRFPQPTELTLDTCPLGHGLWFDRGEMQILAGLDAPGAAGAVSRFFADLFAFELSSPFKENPS